MTRWAKCVLLCGLASKDDKLNYNFIARIVFCMTFLDILSEPTDTHIPNSIISVPQALEYLGYFELSEAIMSDDGSGFEWGLVSILEPINLGNLYEMCDSLE